MSKLVKQLITKDLVDRYSEKDNAVWIELVGVDGNTTNAFRRDLRKNEMRMEIVKTSLFRQACADTALAPLANELEGPAAILTGGDSAIEVAKLLDDWAPKFPKESLRLRGALLDGELINEAQVQTLSKMETKGDLQAKLVLITLSPGKNVAGAMLAPGRNIAGCLKAMIGKLEDGETIAKSA
jgi:large subunit ribosomal protein L10